MSTGAVITRAVRARAEAVASVVAFAVVAMRDSADARGVVGAAVADGAFVARRARGAHVARRVARQRHALRFREAVADLAVLGLTHGVLALALLLVAAAPSVVDSATHCDVRARTGWRERRRAQLVKGASS